MQGIQQVIASLCLAAYIFVGVTILDLPLPELLTLALLFSRLLPMMMSIQRSLHGWLNAVPALAAIEQFLHESDLHKEPAYDPDAPTLQVRDAVELRGVSLRYTQREFAALNDVSVRFPAQTTTAIIGTSGSGKSTLADVLMGLLRVDSGALIVDGKPLTGSQLHQWRGAVAYVPQEVFLYHDTVRANLLMARRDATEADMEEALKKAAAGFVLELADGLDSIVGDNGLRLSGGERQRIALARAMLQHPEVLILDEATSALDSKTERDIRDALQTLHGDITIVLISHRDTTLEHADQVIVLKEGRVAAQGSWDEVQDAR